MKNPNIQIMGIEYTVVSQVNGIDKVSDKTLEEIFENLEILTPIQI